MSLVYRAKCPLCNFSKFKCIYSYSYNKPQVRKFLRKHFSNKFSLKILKNKNFEINECKLCKILFQKIIFNKKYHKKLYENYVKEEVSKRKKINFNTKNFQTYLNELKSIEYSLKKKPREIKILEIGAGWGYWALFARSYNFNVETIEVSPTRQNFIKKNNLISYQNLKKVFKKKFDVIYMDQTFEHLESPHYTLKIINKILKKEGLLIIKVPSGLFSKYKLSNNYCFKNDEFIPFEHINIFNLKTFFYITKKFPFRFKFPFSSKSIFSLIFFKDMIKYIFNLVTNKCIILQKT